MPSASSHYVRIAGEIRGPVTVAQLQEMADIDVVTAATEIAAGPAGPWAPLGTLPLWEEVRRKAPDLKFKAKEIEVLNSRESNGPDMTEVLADANKPLTTFRGREVIVKPQGLRPRREGDAPNEIELMVQDVGQRVAANAPPLPPPKPLPAFPRWRWFLAASVIGSGGILSIPLFYEDGYTQMATSIVGGWTVLYNGLMFGIMVLDRRLRDMSGSKMDPDA